MNPSSMQCSNLNQLKNLAFASKTRMIKFLRRVQFHTRSSHSIRETTTPSLIFPFLIKVKIPRKLHCSQEKSRSSKKKSPRSVTNAAKNTIDLGHCEDTDTSIRTTALTRKEWRKWKRMSEQRSKTELLRMIQCGYIQFQAGAMGKNSDSEQMNIDLD